MPERCEEAGPTAAIDYSLEEILSEAEITEIMASMPHMPAKCWDCPWFEAETRSDMFHLVEVGHRLFPCHHTAVFEEAEGGGISYFVEEPRNRVCFGYLSREVTL